MMNDCIVATMACSSLVQASLLALAHGAGFWGTDCALSYDSQGQVQLLEGQGYKELPGKPLIYVYELPPRFNVW
jgi:hypothetical protein